MKLTAKPVKKRRYGRHVKTFTLRLTWAQHRKLQILCFELGISQSDFMRKTLGVALKNVDLDKPVRGIK
jgi:hypothetical protein